MAEEKSQDNQDNSAAREESAPFPWGMLFVAILFDAVGCIPIVNLATEAVAGLIIGFWQKSYVPQLNPMANFITAKLVDICCLGLFPSNMAIIIRSYLKKKSFRINELVSSLP